MTMGSPMAMGSPTSPGSGGLNQSTYLPSYLMGEPSPMVQTVSSNSSQVVCHFQTSKTEATSGSQIMTNYTQLFIWEFPHKTAWIA